MIIKTLTVENFRKFERQGFRFNSRFNVLIGRNATGKTQTLDALSIILSVYQSKFLGRTTIERGIKKDEVRREQEQYEQENGSKIPRLEKIYPVSVSAQISYRNQTFEQTCVLKSDTGRTTFGGSTPFSQLAKQEGSKVVSKERLTTPFLGYYGVGRSQPLHRRQTTQSKLDSRLDGYRDVLNPRCIFNDMEKWIQNRLWRENFNKLFDVELEIVRKALRTTIPLCSDIIYEPNDMSVCVLYENGTLEPLQNLSDGYRCMLNMVFDIARRIAIINAPVSGIKALEETSGVVLIDEIDSYLHPEWQRSVVDDLKRTFPKLQFIVTTHSPFIIQTLNPGELIHLEKCDGQVYDVGEDFAEPAASGEYINRSPEDITEDVMGVEIPQWSQRRLDMYNAAQEYYKLLNNGEGVSSERKKKLKDELDNLRMRFGTNIGDIAYYAFLNMERLAKESE